MLAHADYTIFLEGKFEHSTLWRYSVYVARKDSWWENGCRAEAVEDEAGGVGADELSNPH